MLTIATTVNPSQLSGLQVLHVLCGVAEYDKLPVHNRSKVIQLLHHDLIADSSQFVCLQMLHVLCGVAGYDKVRVQHKDKMKRSLSRNLMSTVLNSSQFGACRCCTCFVGWQSMMSCQCGAMKTTSCSPSAMIALIHLGGCRCCMCCVGWQSMVNCKCGTIRTRSKKP